MRIILLSIFIVLAVSIRTSGVTFDFGNSPETKANLARQLHDIRFTQNKGQVRDDNGHLRPDILYSAGNNYFKFYFTKKGIIYAWIQAEENTNTFDRRDKSQPLSLKGSLGKKYKTYQMSMELIGANSKAIVQAADPTPDVSHYFLEHCPEGIMNVPSYHKLVYKEVYPSIDFVVYRSVKGFKYDFVVKPGGNVSDIQFKYSGSKNIKLNSNGTLKIDNLFGSITEGKPYTYQKISGKKKKVNSKYKIDDDIISFKVGKYNSQNTLIIDPFIAWASYYGGAEVLDADGNTTSSGSDVANAVATDLFGNVYMTGETSSISGIAHNGFQNEIGKEGCCGANEQDAFLIKFTPSGQREWATYYGRDGYPERAKSIAVDAQNNVYLTGIYSGLGIKKDAVFLLKFSPTGGVSWPLKRLEAREIEGDFSFYEVGSEVSVVADASGNVYLSGSTNDPQFTANPLQNFSPGFMNAFLIKFNSSGDIQWGTYLGGTERVLSNSVAVDNTGNVYIAGSTKSLTGIAFNGYQNTYGGSEDEFSEGDAFLVKYDPNGTRLWGTYYGGTNGDFAKSVAIDKDGKILLAGSTRSITGIALTGHQSTYGGAQDTFGGDAFLIKFAPNGTLLWGTYYGGSKNDYGNSVTTDREGNILLAGSTNSIDNNLTTPDGCQPDYGGPEDAAFGGDAFLVKFDLDGKRIWGTYYGKSSFEQGNGVCTDLAGNIYLIGGTSSPEGMSRGVTGTIIHQGTFGGGGEDAFIVKIDDAAPLLLNTFPENGATNISLNEILKLTFNEPMKTGAGDIIIKENGETTHTFPVNSDYVTIDNTNNSVSIKPPTNLKSSVNVSVEINVGSLKDLVDRNFAGITSVNSWNFTTKDEASPVFSAGYPKIGAVSANSFDIEVQLNEGGKVYYVVVPDGEAPPAPDQVKAGRDATNRATQQKGVIEVTAANNLSFKSVAGLPDSYALDVYLVAEDLSGNLQKVVEKLDVSTTDRTPPAITKISILDFVPLNTTPNLSFKVNDNTSVGKISISWSGLTKDLSNLEKKDILPSSGLDHTYTVNLPAITDEIGLHYTIQAIDGSGNSTELSGKIAVNYPDGMNFKNFNGYGNQAVNYELVSIPLELEKKNAEEVLSELGKYDDTKWRLFMYRNLGGAASENTYVEYGKGLTDLEPGRGYWLLVRKNAGMLNTGAGKTVANIADPNNPFSVELQPGYNLIGNPYNFTLSWEDIQKEPRNDSTAFMGFKPYQNGNPVENAKQLNAFEGAFVFAERKTTLYFPTKKNLNLNPGRKSFTQKKNQDDAHWQLQLTFQAGEKGPNARGGLGMQPQASLSKDTYDDITLPRFMQWAEINFNHPEYFYPDFCQDIVPPVDDYVWEFTAQSNIPANGNELKWDKTTLVFSDKHFVLYDVENQTTVDMKLNNQYRFTSTGAHKFKIYFGSQSFIENTLLPERISLGKSYPNPFSQEITIPYAINQNAQIYFTLQIYDVTGRQIINLYEGTNKPGLHALTWDGRNERGEKMPNGIYLCKLMVKSEKGFKEFSQKLVLHQ